MCCASSFNQPDLVNILFLLGTDWAVHWVSLLASWARILGWLFFLTQNSIILLQLHTSFFPLSGMLSSLFWDTESLVTVPMWSNSGVFQWNSLGHGDDWICFTEVNRSLDLPQSSNLEGLQSLQVLWEKASLSLLPHCWIKGF